MVTEKRLIDANALSNAIPGISKDMKTPAAVELACLLMIAEAPIVDAVEVVHGQWIEILSGQNSSGYECSICKRIICVVSDVDLRERVLAKKYPYCHCGAKMDGGADNGL